MTEANRCRYMLDDGSQCLNLKDGSSHFCEDHSNFLPSDLVVYKNVSEHFRQDLREFWVRSNFYLVVQSGLVSVFVSSAQDSSVFEKRFIIGLGILGFILSVVWFLVARGAWLWIGKWRERMVWISNVVDRHRTYETVESFWHEKPLMSPSTVTQYVPLIFCAAWILLLAQLILGSGAPTSGVM